MSDVFTATLLDGAKVTLRRLGSADIDAVNALHRTLSDRELYLRFFTIHPVYLKILADKLADMSGDDYVLGAFESGTLIGVADYAMCDKPGSADVAVVVAHEDHHRGVGTVLLRRLGQIARDNGVQHLCADVLVTNHEIFEMLRDAGLHPQKSYDSGVVHIDIDLATVSPASAKG
jgi:GNAT superfamily N-acetyltransferase